MYLSNDFIKKNINVIEKNNFDYMVFKQNIFQWEEDKERAGYAFEILMLCNTVNWINQAYNKIGTDKAIDIDIFTEAAKTMFTEQPFTNDQLFRYFEAKQDYEEFNETMIKLINETTLPEVDYHVDFVLLGFSYEKQTEISKAEIGKIYEEYSKISFEVTSRKMEVVDFIKEAKRMLGKYFGSREGETDL